MDLPPPDILATEVAIGTLNPTGRSLAHTARRAGYTIRATRALGPRIPRQASQPIERATSTALTGVMGRWRFTAIHTDRDGWNVTIHRPGWPTRLENVTTLRKMLAAQTPATIRGR